jgi:archaeal flagellar protein FlaI
MNNFNTFIDSMIDAINSSIVKDKKGFVKLNYLKLVLGKDMKDIVSVAEFLESRNIAEIHYPVNIFSSPKIKIIKNIIKEEKQSIKDTYVDSSYDVKSDQISFNVEIYKKPSEDVPFYRQIFPEYKLGTQTLIEGLTEELSSKINATIEEVSDLKAIAKKRILHLQEIIQEIKRIISFETDQVITIIASHILHNMYGIGKIELLLADNYLEEIAINGSKQPIAVYHKRYGWLKTSIHISSEDEIFNISAKIGRGSGQQINYLHPIMDANLPEGDRVASTIFPISRHGNTITIRKFSKSPWTITNFLDPEIKLFSTDMAAFIWLAMQYEMNIIVAGGTAAGKTSVLNVLSSLIPPKNRVLSVEDTRELELPESLEWNWVPLVSKAPNPDGTGEVSMLSLIVAALRMRPDRIIVGEIRRQEQALALFEAMHTGHSVYATMHADTAEQAKRRLLEPPIKVPKSELGSLHLLIIQYRDRKSGRRRTKQIVEIIDNEQGIELNIMYRWDPRTDTFETVNPSKRIYEEVNLHTGMTTEEIDNDIKRKTDVLEWMLEIKDINVDIIGQIMRMYYLNEKLLLECIDKKYSLEQTINVFSNIIKRQNGETIKSPDKKIEIKKEKKIKKKIKVKKKKVIKSKIKKSKTVKFKNKNQRKKRINK